ncbi:lysophospholipid acyltransferase family protein [Maricaulis maris]|uniref:1-acyl-sn-glycerol-3-phosphate acyltransferase n=1 Tax=Maricaulis maris TaxID=74318 RepID=A0A495CYF2_9PROT|nr:lysophospholipid acyltransferase family protein [Maricaulis maris]RKQ94223.1 1-acyl-sn-glycerol-3-phosphate acyltransferase [Maricaulis maris]
MRLLRSLVFYIWMYGLMAVFGLIGTPLLLGPRHWARKILRAYLKVVWFGMRWILGVRFEVRGRQHLTDGGALVASKHMSMWETLAFWEILPDPAIILKKSLVYMPFFGWFAVKLGNISIDRDGGGKALKGMLRDAAKRGSENRQVLIFPEGTRVRPGEAPEFKPGIAGLYKSMNKPCIPVALNSGVHLETYCGLRKPGLIVVEFLEPIAPGLDKASFMNELHTRINQATDALLAADPELATKEI